MRKNKLLEIDLRLFDGAAGAPAGGESAGAGAPQGNEGALPKAEVRGRTGGSRRSRSGAYDNVVFGKQGTLPQPMTRMAPTPGAQARVTPTNRE